MGLQDRDYWKERYDKNLGVKSAESSPKNLDELQKLTFFQQEEKRLGSSSDPEANEYSFIAKFVMLLIVLFCAVLGYRYWP